MAICGLATNREGHPSDVPALERALRGLSFGHEDYRLLRFTGGVGFAAISPFGIISVSNDNSLFVAAEADLLNLDDLFEEAKANLERGNTAQLLSWLYRQHGSAFLSRLRGTFAIALWDHLDKKLILATDRFGIRPLCYHVSPDQVLFASSPRGILATGRLVRKANPLGLVNYLNFGVVPVPLCAFEGIEKLPAGALLEWKAGVATVKQYWDMNYTEDALATEKQLAREMLIRMEEAVLRTSSGIPGEELGCFLSGGTDSSSVVGLLSRSQPEPVTSVSVGFAEERYDELGYAELAARHFGSRHLVARLGPGDAFPLIHKIVEAFDEPYANASAIPAFYCQKLAHEHGIRTMLAGDGGDELFGGNERYRTHEVYELYKRIPKAFRRAVIEPLLALSPSWPRVAYKLRRYTQISNCPSLERYFRWHLLQYFPASDVLGLEMDFADGHRDSLEIPRAYYDNAPATSQLNRILYIDVKMTLTDNDLPKVMRTADMLGIRVRFPLLDHPLAEFSGHLPARLKVRGLEKRYLFKKATAELLPPAILQKKKHGFGLPVAFWLKSDPRFRAMAEDVLFDPRTYQRGYFRRQFVEHVFTEMDRDDTPFFGDLLWEFLILELWHRRHVEERPL
jgi:asparagine synthase (glutamine-hydrolysing)